MTGRERERPHSLEDAWQGAGMSRGQRRTAWHPFQAPALLRPAGWGAEASFYLSQVFREEVAPL